MERLVSSPNFVTGLEVEKHSFVWIIKGFPLIRKYKPMIESQRIDFTAGQTTGCPSKWSLFLHEIHRDDKRWIGIFLQLKSSNATEDTFKTSYVSAQYIIVDTEENVIKNETIETMHATKFAGGSSWGVDKYIDADDANCCPEESLEIYVRFKLYTISKTVSLEATMKEFQAKFSDQLRTDLSGLVRTVADTEIKIISKDKKEFFMQRQNLAARSEVFAAMLASDMAEANSGVIQLPDISSKALKVLLNFLNTGDLLLEWSEADVIVELTNAAAKYQLKELLQFLDVTMGKVCQLQNVVALVNLARQLSLKVAEEELMMYARKEGMGSSDNFIQMCNAGRLLNDSMSSTQ